MKTVLKKYDLKRVVREEYEEYTKVAKSPEDLYEMFEEIFNLKSMTREHFVMFSLNTKKYVEGAHLIHVGSLNASIVHPRDVYQLALLDNAASIAVAHNHPSGESQPSQEDIHVTRRLVEAGKILGIELLDHLIIGEGFKSLKELGYI